MLTNTNPRHRTKYIDGAAFLLADFTDADYRVTQMKFPGKADKTRVVYNQKSP